jgi:NAD+ kinase
MKLNILGRDKSEVEILKRKLKKFKEGLEIDEKDPEIIITFGGDGSFLVAERKFPGIPKLILKHNSVCKKCVEGDLEEVLEKLAKGEYRIEKCKKVEAIIIKQEGPVIKKIASNDIIVSNRLPYRALRFKVEIDDKLDNEFIGDGIVVATGFGSTGYFQSITQKEFSENLGVAFNNVTEKQGEIFLEKEVVKLEVLRNDAYVSADNDPVMVILKEGDKIEIKQSEREFSLVKV